MPNVKRSDLKSQVSSKASGGFRDSDFNTLANIAVKEVLDDVGLPSTIRRTTITPNLFHDIFAYNCPTDLKKNKIIDIQPQAGGRSRFDSWKLVTPEEFDRWKREHQLGKVGDPVNLSIGSIDSQNLVAIKRDSMNKKLLLSKVVDDDEITVDSLDSIGDWSSYGDGTNLSADNNNFIEGTGAINWDIDDSGGTTAGISNTSLEAMDISDYLMDGSFFAWVYLSSSNSVTNFKLRIGSDASNYYEVIVTSNNEDNSFVDGWNLLRFDLSGKSETGSVTATTCDYVALFMTKDSSKTSETDYRFDDFRIKKGDYYYLEYYSKYGWQTSGGSWKLEANDDTDLLNAEIDEVKLIRRKTLQHIEDHLGNDKKAQLEEKRYNAVKQEFNLENPSQGKPLVNSYYNFNYEQ